MQDDLLQAVKDATEDEYELLGELSGTPGRVAYLARERSTGGLVALVLQEDDTPGGGDQFDLAVVRELDDSVPVAGHTCHLCGARLDAWSRFCDACDGDVSGAASDEAVPGVSRGVLLDEVRSATDGEFEILGSMERSDGGGAVYFARELATGRLAGLSLQREEGAAGDEFTLVVSWLESDGTPDGQEPPDEPAPFGTAVAAAGTPERGYPPEPSTPPVPEPRPPRPPAGDRTDRRRLLVVAGVGVAAVLGAGLLFALVSDPDEPVRPVAVADSTAAPPGPAPSDSAPVLPAVLPPAGGTPAAAAPTEPSPRPVRETPAEREEPRAEERPAPPPPRARPAQSVEAAVGRFAQAVQSRDAGRIRSAYPDITDGELSRWRDHLSAGGQVGYSMQTDPAVDGGTAEAVFVVTVRPSGGAPIPMTFRGIFEQADGGWRLKEARSLGGF